MLHGHLFSRMNIDDFMQRIRIAVEKEVDGMSVAELNQDLGQLCDYFVEKFAVNVPVLSDTYHADEPPNTPYASSVTLKCYIPFRR